MSTQAYLAGVFDSGGIIDGGSPTAAPSPRPYLTIVLTRKTAADEVAKYLDTSCPFGFSQTGYRELTILEVKDIEKIKRFLTEIEPFSQRQSIIKAGLMLIEQYQKWQMNNADQTAFLTAKVLQNRLWEAQHGH